MATSSILQSRARRWLGALLAVALSASSSLADGVDDIVKAHLDAIGGRARVEALGSMRVTGTVFAGEKQARFTMLAVRPNKVRVEFSEGTRTVVQATDGRTAWEYDSSEQRRYRDMPPSAAKTFVTDAEFDDPLVAGSARGFTIEDAGEVTDGGKRLKRLLVTKDLSTLFALALDPDTLLIVTKTEERKNSLGTPVRTVTRFDDYRPVAGVLVPHHVSLTAGSRLVQDTRISTIEPNPPINEGLFTRPAIQLAPK